jgi:hypothetical protein
VTNAERYLRLPTKYCDALGGVRWSFEGDELVYKDGSCFALNEEVAMFLEGMAAGGRTIHFAYALHLLGMFKGSTHPRSGAVASPRLSQAYPAARRLPRNAGAFAAVLCRDLPALAGAPRIEDVLSRLRDTARPIRWYIVSFHDTFAPSEMPPLSEELFEAEILQKLEAYSDDDLRQWLRYGCGPVKEPGKDLARALELPPPRSLADILAALLERPRLAGARPYVMQMLSALAMPPRKQLLPAMPQGGYADVTTHGQPDRLLPSQFALDEWDFLRRHADNELLYFRREDPHARTRHELIVLLDQGVRTWGKVRLVLSAAALALGQLAARSKMPFLLATTSDEGAVVDPLEMSVEALGSQVEAADLSANPGLALERVLDRPATGTRDIVLLTQPRNLLDDEIRAAALRAVPETRILSLALHENGNAVLSELRQGVPLPLRQFRVRVTAAGALPDVTPPVEEAWHGDIEPIGFPFRFGPTGQIGRHHFDFDLDGQWLLTAMRKGMLFVWATDGSRRMEVLPRAMVNGRLLESIDAICGVAGGFVVSSVVNNQLTVAHYDLQSKRCAGYVLGSVAHDHVLRYSPEHHVVVAQTAGLGFEHALDLGTGCIFPANTSDRAARAREAWYALAQAGTPSCSLDRRTGMLIPIWPHAVQKPFVPQTDGRPDLQGCTLVDAEFRGAVLAAKLRTPGLTGRVFLRLYRDGVSIGEYPNDSASNGFKLSADGSLLARQIDVCRLNVSPTAQVGTPSATTRAGGCAPLVYLYLGDSWILLRSGMRWVHLLSWETGRLELHQTQSDQNETKKEGYRSHSEALRFLRSKLPHSAHAARPTYASPSALPHALLYDANRFAGAATQGAISVATDQFGQVMVLDKNSHLVCMFFAFRDQISGWMPDGTSFGPASHSGRPPSPDDLLRFGRALTKAALGRSK